MNLVQSILEHHGVKGQKWGIRNNRDASSDQSQGSTESAKGKQVDLSDTEKEVVKKLAPHGYTEDRMRKMFGPGSPGGEAQNKQFHLSDGQKKALLIGGGVVVGGAALYGLHKFGQSKLIDMALPKDASPALRNFWHDSQIQKLKTQGKELSRKEIENLSTEGVHLSPGSILKRISTVKESDMNPDGFYAAFKPDDVERYKAVLPVYWKLWGYDANSGFVVNVKAKEAIKAPSPKQTFDLFVDFLGKSGETGTKNRDTFFGHLAKKNDTDADVARKLFSSFGLNWVNTADPLNKAFFSHVKNSGFNALIDINDAGSLGDTPLRILDGSIFNVDGHEILRPSDILSAQKKVMELVHALRELLSNVIRKVDAMDTKEFLAHYGVKGQKWGVRRRTPSEDAARAAAFKKKRVHELSDAELKSLVNRMNLEQNHRRLSQSSVSRGLAVTGTILAAGVTVNRAIEFSHSAAGKHLIKAIKSAADKATNIPVSSIGKTIDKLG